MCLTSDYCSNGRFMFCTSTSGDLTRSHTRHVQPCWFKAGLLTLRRWVNIKPIYDAYPCLLGGGVHPQDIWRWSGNRRLARTLICCHGDPDTRTEYITTGQSSPKNICITFVQWWANVEDVGPTLYKCYANVLCLLGLWSFLSWGIRPKASA